MTTTETTAKLSRIVSVLSIEDRIVAEIDRARDELVELAAELIRVPTVNPPGEHYLDCARLVGERLETFGFDTEYYEADDRPEHTARHPRVNVVGRRAGARARPLVHLNGHLDVVPVGDGWTVDPFAGTVRDGRLYGRGSSDMKGGIAAAIFACEAIRRASTPLAGSVEVSGTVDEESGGWAGAALLAERGRLTARTTDFVIIPEPLNVDRICIGHRGVYWCELTTHGRIAHGSMPFLGVSAIDHMGAVLEAIRTELQPALTARTTSMPVVPDAARHATLNVNTVSGGQVGHLVQTPCVADRCTAVLDRRFLAEESFELAKREIVELVESVARRVGDFRYTLRDLMVVDPVRTPDDSPLVAALQRSIETVVGRPSTLVASPGTYDHKHVTRIGGIAHCVAYGPGVLDNAHQPDEWCDVDDLMQATKVIALTIAQLVGLAS